MLQSLLSRSRILLSIGLLFGALFIVSPVHAAVPNCDSNNNNSPICSPACSSSQDCTYISGTCNTECVAAGTTNGNNTTVSDVVVTASSGSGTTFATIVNKIVSIVSGSLVPVLYALAFLYFVYGLTRYVFAEGEENRAKGRNVMMYGLIGLVVIFGVWGFVGLLLRTLNTLSGGGTG